MFECKQDTALLHGSFLSVVKQVNSTKGNDISKGLFNLSKLELKQVESIISDTVKLCLRGIGCLKWTSKDEVLTNERLHAIIFYTTIRSSGIICENGDVHYSSAVSVVPKMDWGVYLALVRACQWSKQLIQCVTQLPEAVALTVARWILLEDSKWELDDYYIKHSLFQVALCNILHTDCFANALEPSVEFDFQYVMQHQMSNSDNCTVCDRDKGSCISTLCKASSFCDILEYMLDFDSDLTSELNILKLLLSGLLTSLDCVLLNEQKKACSLLISVDKLFQVSEEFFSSISFLALLESSSLNFFSSEVSVSNFKDILLEEDIGFLMSLIRSGWKELSSNMYDADCDQHNSVLSQVERIVCSLESFFAYKIKAPSTNEQCAQVLSFVIDNNLPRKMRCMGALLLEENLLKRDNVVSCLARNQSTIASRKLFLIQLLDVMMKDVLFKEKLGHLFFEALEETETSLQLELLHYFLSRYGASSLLKQQNFTVQVVPILNQTTNIIEAASQIIPLCLQCPEDVINKVLHQGVNGNSGQYQFLVQILKFFSNVCTFRKTPDDVQLLVYALKTVFSVAYCSKEHRNKLKKFLKVLFQAIDETFPISTCDVLTLCILPYIGGSKLNIAMKLSLESLEIIFRCCLNTGNIMWLKELNVPAFIVCMCQVIDSCISSVCGSTKETAASIICLLSQLLDKLPEESISTKDVETLTLWFRKHLSSMNRAVYFYAHKVISKYTSSSLFDIELSALPLSQLWLFSCIWKEEPIDLIAEKLIVDSESACSSLLIVLCQLLPHFTFKEWKHSSVLLKKFLNIHLVKCLDSGISPVVIVTKMLVNAVLSLNECKDIHLEWTHIVNCLSQAISAELQCKSNVLCSKTLIALLFELLRVVQSLEEDHLNNLVVLLLDITKILKTILEDEKDSESLLYQISSIIHTLPDSSVCSQVLESLEKPIV